MMNTTEIDWGTLMASAPEMTEAQYDEVVATSGWLVTTDGRVEDFESFRRPFDAPRWGDGGVHENPKDVWLRAAAGGHVYRDFDEAHEVAEETRKARVAEARTLERRKAGYLDWADATFWDPPTPKVVIPRLALEGQVCEIYSPGGVGKSLTALDIVVGLSLRGETFGEVVEPATVIYLDRENSKRGLSKRLLAMGVSRKDAKALHASLHYSLLGLVPSLDTPEGGAWLFAEVRKTGAMCVVIDTMSKVVSGEENSNDTWKGLHNATLVGLRAAGITVVLLDHVGKDSERGPRGGSAKRDNCDVMWSLERYGILPTGDEVFKVTNRKDREGDFGGEGHSHYLVRESAPVLRHRFATDPEVVACVAGGHAAAKEADLKEEVLRVARDAGGPISQNAIEKKIKGYRVQAVREAFKALKESGELAPDGSYLGASQRTGRTSDAAE